MLHNKPNSVQITVKKNQIKNSLYEDSNKMSLFEHTIAESSIWVLLLKIIKSSQIPFISGKHQLLQKYKSCFQGKPFPWFKLSLLALGLYMVFQKDMRFQINMKSPAQLFSDLSPENREPTALSMSLVHPEKRKLATNKSAISYLNLTDAKVKAYVARFNRIALMEMQKFNIPASIKMGQAILASQAGENSLATKYNNHFGTLCNLPDDICGQYDAITGVVKVKKYSSAWESWRDHSEAISKVPYTTLRQYGKDYKQWAEGIAEIGYGGNQEYSTQLIQIIEQFQLYKLDEQL